jgi:hypothetical protein
MLRVTDFNAYLKASGYLRKTEPCKPEDQAGDGI